MSDLTQYKNLIDWALNAHVGGDSTLPGRKRILLIEINGAFKTNYQQKHIDNWIRPGESKQAPIKVLDYFRDRLIGAEIQTNNPELGKQLRRLMYSTIKCKLCGKTDLDISRGCKKPHHTSPGVGDWCCLLDGPEKTDKKDI